MSPQLLASLKRAAILLGAMLLPGLVAIYPQLMGEAPLNVHAMIRAFVAAVVGGLVSRFGEGVYDGNRQKQVERGNVDVISTADVGGAAAKELLRIDGPTAVGK